MRDVAPKENRTELHVHSSYSMYSEGENGTWDIQA